MVDSGESTCNSKIKKGFSAGTVHKAAVAADASLTLVFLSFFPIDSNLLSTHKDLLGMDFGINLQAYDKSHQLIS